MTRDHYPNSVATCQAGMGVAAGLVGAMIDQAHDDSAAERLRRTAHSLPAFIAGTRTAR